MGAITNRQLFLANLAQTSHAPLLMEVESAHGVYLNGPEGQQWIDLISGISVSNVGHSHPKVVEAIQNQVSKYMHIMVYGELVLSPQVLFARALLDRLPSYLDNCYFVNSGSEAIEGALKLAKRYTGRPEIVAFNNAYHGSTHGALSIMGSEYFRNSFRPLLPGVNHLDFDNAEQLALITNNTACVVIELVRGEVGAEEASKNFISQVQDRCKQTGALLVVDEIQSGFHRTGPFMAFMDYNIKPDILVLGKSIGGGMPMGAFIASRNVMACLAENPVLGHITTFGGHPVCCAAAKASLEVLSAIGGDEIERKANLFRSLLVHPAIKSITGKGLMMGLTFSSEQVAKDVIQACIQNGVLTDWFLFAPHKLRLAPPLVINDNEIKIACDRIIKSIDQVVN